MPMNPWLGMSLVVGTLAGLMGGLRVAQKRWAPHPEGVRKVLHVGMGLVTLTFPWLFTEAWPVVCLAAITSLGLLAVRRLKPLHDSVGSVICGVERSTLGEIYFPLAVALLFVLALREPPAQRALLYCIPILILALADALAALIGIRFGRLHYQTVEGHKSTEGSFAFFSVAFLSTWWPLQYGNVVDGERVWLIALLLGFLAMLFEAIAWRGLDNLVLPLASFLLLKSYLHLEIRELLARVAITSALVAFALFYRWRTTLAGSAILGAVLVGYLSWALGGWPWLLPPLLVFVTYKLWPTALSDARRAHTVHAVLCVSSGGLVWLFLSRFGDWPALLFPYTLAYAAHMAIIGVVRLKRAYPLWRGRVLVPVCTLVAGGLLVGPLLWTELIPGRTLDLALAALLGISGATASFYLTQPGMNDCPTDSPRWLRQALLAGLGSLAGLAPLAAL
jgi:phytol kinase